MTAVDIPFEAMRLAMQVKAGRTSNSLDSDYQEVELLLRHVGPLIIARHLLHMAARYPADVFTDTGKTTDAIAGTALRIVLTQEALALEGKLK